MSGFFSGGLLGSAIDKLRQNSPAAGGGGGSGLLGFFQRQDPSEGARKYGFADEPLTGTGYYNQLAQGMAGYPNQQVMGQAIPGQSPLNAPGGFQLLQNSQGQGWNPNFNDKIKAWGTQLNQGLGMGGDPNQDMMRQLLLMQLGQRLWG